MNFAVESRRHACSQRGYSLIEVLVGCALAGVVMTAAVPTIPPMLASFQLQNATFEIANDLRLARERAVTTNGKGRIVFGTTNYQLRRESPVGSGTYVNDGASHSLPSNTTATSNPANPTFDSRGLTSAGYTITVANAYSTKTITVSAIGRVAVN